MPKRGDDRTHAAPTLAGRRGRANERLERAFAVLRFFHYVALVVGVVVACAGAAAPARTTGIALTATLAAISPDAANADRWAAPSPELPARRHCARMRAVVEKETEESDLDDEEAPVFDIAESPSVRSNATTRGTCGGRRAHFPSDTSRFAAGTGLPRGPPQA